MHRATPLHPWSLDWAPCAVYCIFHEAYRRTLYLGRGGTKDRIRLEVLKQDSLKSPWEATNLHSIITVVEHAFSVPRFLITFILT